MRFDILTIFPDMFESPLNSSILARARESGLLEVDTHDIREFTTDKHRCVDDAPYAGGGGMVMKAGPVVDCVRSVREQLGFISVKTPLIHLSPQGEMLTNNLADELAQLPGMILLCGNYEGIDERALEMTVDREISIGDYVLTGGEYAALVLMNAVIRKVPGVLGNDSSAPNDSFENGLLDFPHYTRPEIYEDGAVPEILLSGHAANIARWRREQSLRRTLERRPDLLETAPLTDEDRKFLDQLRQEQTP